MDQSTKSALFGAIKLKKDISLSNYYSIIFHNIILGFFLNGTELLQQLLLSDPDYYDIIPKKAIKVNADITLFDLLSRLSLAALYGSLIDKLGRKKMIMCGYVLIALGICLFPIRGYFHNLDSLFPWFYIARFIYANGSSIVLLMPFIADYIEDESKGKATGINAIALASGFLFGTTSIKELYNTEMNLKYVCLIVAGFLFMFGMAYSSFLKGGSEYYKVIPEIDESDTSITSSQIEKETKITFAYIKQIMKERPWISVSFVFALLNGANLGIVTQILNFFVENLGTDVPENLGAQMVQYANIAGVLSTIVFGLMLDYTSPVYIATPVILLGLSMYSFTWVIKDPYNVFLIFIALVAGMSYSSCQLLMNYLGFVYYPGVARGRLYAMANLISFCGNLLITVIGGNLVNYVNQYSPFYLIAVCTFAGGIIFANIYVKRIRTKKKSKRSKIRTESEPLLNPA